MDSDSTSRCNNNILFIVIYIGWICGEWAKTLIYSFGGRDEDSLGQEESLFMSFLARQASLEPFLELGIYVREFQDL